jgi:hypothetical protein
MYPSRAGPDLNTTKALSAYQTRNPCHPRNKRHTILSIGQARRLKHRVVPTTTRRRVTLILRRYQRLHGSRVHHKVFRYPSRSTLQHRQYTHPLGRYIRR